MHDTQEISQRECVLPDMFCFFSFNVCRKDKRKELLLYKPSRHRGEVVVYRNQYTTPALEEGGR
jgi:hypothetical protein